MSGDTSMSATRPRGLVTLQAVLDAQYPTWDTDGLLLRLAGDANLAAECTDIFCADAEERLAQIAGELTSGDLERIGRQFHSLKGAAGTAGAEFFAHLAAWAERRVAAGTLEDVDALLTTMRRELQHVRSAVARFLAAG
jgi:HPt (histidine-containing phosphotransfer) domain-containing protein